MSKLRKGRELSVAVVAIAGLVLVGCATIPLIPESVVHTPEYHHRLGGRHLEKGNIEQALIEFEWSKRLAPKYGPAHDGLAQVYLERGDYEGAEENVRLALRYDRRNPGAHITRGRIYMAQNRLKKARKSFQRAIRLAPKSAEPHFYIGRTYMKSFDFDRAEQAFKKALEIDPDFVRADKEWARADRIKRAQPGSKTARELALIDEIKRAEVAALLISELDLDKRLAKRVRRAEEAAFTPPAYVRSDLEKKAESLAIGDIRGHWAEGSIRMVLALDLMSLFPGDSFQPNAALTRANLARIVQRVLIAASGDERLSTRFFDSASPFPDVPNTHYAFNAVMVTTTRGIMEAKIDGTFGLDDSVSGADALLALRKLGEVLEGNQRLP